MRLAIILWHLIPTGIFAYTGNPNIIVWWFLVQVVLMMFFIGFTKDSSVSVRHIGKR